MDRIKTRQFRGNWFLLLFLSLFCLILIGIPIVIVYVIESTIEIEYEVKDAEEFLKFHYGKRAR